jgi:hypothetical protein
MKANLQAERNLLNRNVDEMIRLFQRATGAEIWTPQEGARHRVSSREIECRF